MQILYGVCCGLDVHKKEITAALMTVADEVVVKKFGTTTSALRTMVDWLKDIGCEQMAMESTGVYWKPVYNIFELEGIPAMVVNAAHMKALPGRKTDVDDAEWIADLYAMVYCRQVLFPKKTNANTVS